MFDFIRTHQRLMQLVLLVLILPSFVLIGVSGYSTYTSGDRDLVKVGDDAVTQQAFDMARRSQLEQLQRSFGGAIDPAMLDNPATREVLLESLVDQHLQVGIATEERFSVSDTALRRAIASMPQWQENGRFSSAQYNAVLAASGLTPKQFEQSQRAELALGRVLGPIGGSADVPRAIVDQLGEALTRQRTVRVRTFPAADYRQGVEISEADLQTWYEANSASLSVPEHVSIQYLVLDEAAATASLATPDEKALQDYYQQNKKRYVQPARVSLRHIQVALPEGDEAARKAAQDKAADLAAKAKADPAGFAALAQSSSEDAGTARDGGRLGWITQGSWPPEVEQVVFALDKGQVSDAVPGPGGLHVFLVEDKQAEQGESFEQARATVETEVRRQLAAARYADMATQLTGLVYDHPDSLEPAAQALGVTLRTADGLTRDGLLPEEQVGKDAASASPDAAQLNDPRVRQAVFSAQVYNEKHNSGVIELAADKLLVLRLGKVVPARVPALAEVADTIRETLLAERAQAAAQAAGEKVLASLREAGKPAADQAPEGFGDELNISRSDPAGLSAEAVTAAFRPSAQALPQFEGLSGHEGYVILLVSAEAPSPSAQGLSASLAAQLDDIQGQAEAQAVLRALRAHVGVQRLPDADRAIAGELDGEN